MMKARGTFLVPTLFTVEYVNRADAQLPPEVEAKARAASAASSNSFRNALRIGVKVGYGTDAAVFPHGMNAKDFAIMVRYGMNPIAALKSATSANAELLGLANQLGSIEEGKLADLVAMQGDVLEDITSTERVSFVMKGGIVASRVATHQR